MIRGLDAMEQQIPAGNDRKKCKGKCKSNSKCNNNRRSFGSATLRSG